MDPELEAEVLPEGAERGEDARGEDRGGTRGLEPPGSDSSDARRSETCGTLALYLEEVRCRRPSANGAGRCCCNPRGIEAAKDGAGPGERSTRECFEANRAAIVEGHLDLVVRLARHYRGLGLPLEDLIQEGNLGLLAAFQGFDPDRGVPFSIYATGWIRQAICRAISIKTRTIRIPLETLGLRRNAASVLSDLEQEAHNGALRSGRYRAPTVGDCARKLGVSTEHLATTIRRLPDVESFDAPGATEGEPLLSCLADASGENPEDRAAAEERRSRLEASLRTLPDRARLVVQRRYGLDGNGTASFTEIGRELHLSRERVRQLHHDAVAQLRGDRPLCASAN